MWSSPVRKIQTSGSLNFGNKIIIEKHHGKCARVVGSLQHHSYGAQAFSVMWKSRFIPAVTGPTQPQIYAIYYHRLLKSTIKYTRSSGKN